MNDSKKIKIAILDDSKTFCSSLQIFLEEYGNSPIVYSSSNYVDFMEAYTKRAPDVILLDIQMPDISGYSVIDEVLRANPEQKIILVSMNSDIDYIDVAKQKGAKGFVIKTDIINSLIPAIQKVYMGGTYYNEPFKIKH